ncbi:MAG TPA: serine hydrolase domain-containing protein [Candidatus Baltobacteraceae bacterium]|jgi:CubicO group peptidase (beta-lactamase class C family)|nr:serine hydrolase domain-containing protein [Candidatus Baltobacteraceae bacterium]
MRLFVLAALLAAAAAPSSWDATTVRVETYASQAARLGRFNGVVVVARGQHVYRGAFGYADIAKRAPNTMQTQFEIASLTKMFTAFAILKLRDEGRLRLSDSVCRYLSPCPQQWQAVTIDEVLHHRSGIPDYESSLEMESDAYYAFMTQPNDSERILQREEAPPLDFPPGTKFSYSNTGYIVLGFIIEKAAGTSYAAYMHAHILGPAHMTHTGIIGVDPAPQLAVGYSAPDLTWAQRLAGFDVADVHAKPVPKLTLASPHGDAALFSTADDLLAWARIMLGANPTLVSSAERREIFTSIDGYGDGWMISPQFGRERYRHTGELPGFLSNIAIYPNDDTIVIMLDNLDTPMNAVTRDLNAAVLDAPYDAPVSGTQVALAPAQAQQLTGAYKTQDGSIACVSIGKQFLEIAIRDRFTAGLIPLAPDRFYMPLSAGTVTFTSTSLNMRYNGEDHRAARIPQPC